MKSAGSAKQPVLEQILINSSESFLWRLDDYPLTRTVWNVHPECEIHLIRNASGIALIGDHIGEFGPGHLTMVGGGLPHDWVTVLGPGEAIVGRDIVLQFDPGRLRDAGTALPELAEVEPLIARSRRGLSFTGDTRRAGGELVEEIGRAAGLDRLARLFRLLGLLARSPEYVILSSENFTPNVDAASVQIFRRVMAFVLDNFTVDIRLGDLAALAGMSESAFSRFFKKNSGNSFSDHIMKLRIGRACKLLADSDLGVTDICFEIGYANISNFNRSFRQQRGMTPSAYRRLARRLRR